MALILGGAVAVALGVYGSVHDPTGRSLVPLSFTATLDLKVWLATGAISLALFQLATAARMWGWIGSGRPDPGWARLTGISGTAAFVLSLPVAYCLCALGFTADAGARVLVHSLVGCFLYGAFVAKVLAARSHNLGRCVPPLLGGLAFTDLVTIWLTSSLWFFTTVEFPGAGLPDDAIVR